MEPCFSGIFLTSSCPSDKIIVATNPIPENLYRINVDTGMKELTGFGREFQYLLDHGYVYNTVTKRMILKQ